MAIRAEQIIKNCNCSLHPDPSMYTGRGNSVSDMDSCILELLYHHIKVEVHKNAARAFVNMVNDLSKAGDISATTFLVSLYRLEEQGWVYGGKTVNHTSALAETRLKLRDRNEPGTESALNFVFGAQLQTGQHMRGCPVEWITRDFLLVHTNEINSAPAGTQRVLSHR